jgi:hypothetical protein
MLWIVMSGFCFWNVPTSSSHSLCWAGELDGGAQSTLIVTLPPAAELAGVLEHAAAASPRAATAATPAICRQPPRRRSCLLIGESSLAWNMAMTQHT